MLLVHRERLYRNPTLDHLLLLTLYLTHVDPAGIFRSHLVNDVVLLIITHFFIILEIYVNMYVYEKERKVRFLNNS